MNDFNQFFDLPQSVKNQAYVHQKLTDIQRFTSSLDTNIKFVSGFEQNSRIQFEKMRRYSGSILVDERDHERGYNTTCTCGVKRLNSDNEKSPVNVVRGASTGKIFYNGLMKCGSVWRCPVCGFKIMKHRQDELYFMSSEWLRKGFEISFITLTMRHRASFKLEKSLEILLSEFRKFQCTKVYKNLEAQHEINGFVRTLEITYGAENGWHPHLHLLVFHKSKDIKDLHREFISGWCKRNKINALHRSQRAKRVYNGDGVTEYVTKWDMTKEMTQNSVKNPHGSERYTPYSMLKLLANREFDGFTQGVLHWRFIEYCKATKGRHFIVISKKMKAFFREEKGEDIKTDEEILQDEKVDTILFKIDVDLWDTIAKDKRIFPAYILNAYENGGISCVLELLSGIGYNVHYLFDRNIIVPISDQIRYEVPKNTLVYVKDFSGWQIRRFSHFTDNGVSVFRSQLDANDTRLEYFKEYSFCFPF